MQHAVMTAFTALPEARLLKETSTRCPVCHARVPGRVVSRLGKVWLDRTCPQHGASTACLASDERFYWLALGSRPAEGCGSGCACAAPSAAPATAGRNAAGRGDATFETLSTCLALIEIVRSCNLSCPTCYADSPHPNAVDAVPLDEIKSRIQGVIDRKGKIEILQLSGGEPTLHPQLIELCRWLKQHPSVDFVLLNTNGVRLAADPRLAEEIVEAFEGTGIQVYLQFDGVQSAGQQDLRGADLRAMRLRALARCAEAGLSVTLAMTVLEANLSALWDTVAFAVSQPGVHGITFQPLFGSGRVTNGQGSSRRLNSADILTSLIDRSAGKLGTADFTPLPCGDPNCAIIGYLIRTPDGFLPVSHFLDFSRLQGFLHDKLQYTLADLARCGCENQPLGELLHSLELRGGTAFRIMVKPFMDAWSWDDDRNDRCCTHVIRPDGKLDSFCRYYSGFPDCQPSP